MKQAGKKQKKSHKRIRALLRITEDLNHVKDVDSLLERILNEACRFTNADAGTIFLKQGDILKFSYVYNESLARTDPTSNKYIYSTQTVEINEKSIAGFVALSGEPLVIDDAYTLDENVPYSFNRSFDEMSSYRTRSILTVPLITSREKVIGVMQVINAKSKKKQIVKSFSEDDKMYVNFFANNASVAIERAQMTREIILRMIKMAELRDPKETASHVNRVGAYSIEIFEYWAKKRRFPRQDLKRIKDLLRIAAMLHDVGKVAISDTILKKPARLSTDEFSVMQGHTIYGARLFGEAVSDLDAMSAEIALNHHERWDGKGYPGKCDDIFLDPLQIGVGKKGEEIPVTARIVALADVYDALCSKRVYKDAWKEEDVLNYIREQSGQQFDPAIVEAFFAIYDVVKAIRQKYQDD